MKSRTQRACSGAPSIRKAARIEYPLILPLNDVFQQKLLLQLEQMHGDRVPFHKIAPRIYFIEGKSHRKQPRLMGLSGKNSRQRSMCRSRSRKPSPLHTHRLGRLKAECVHLNRRRSINGARYHLIRSRISTRRA